MGDTAPAAPDQICKGTQTSRGAPADYLVVFAGMPEEVSEEVKSGTFSHQDEVSGAVGQVSGRGKAFGTAGTSTAHAGGVYSQELSSDRPPLTVTLWRQIYINDNSHTHKYPLLLNHVSSIIQLNKPKVFSNDACYHTHRCPRLRPSGTAQLSQSASLHCADKQHIWTRGKKKHICHLLPPSFSYTGPVRNVGRCPRQHC